jgi:hypothetical protein
MSKAFVALFLTKLLAAAHHPGDPSALQTRVTIGIGQSIACVSVTRPEMRGLGWKKSIGAGCANLNTTEVLGGVLTLQGSVRCKFTGTADLATGCAVIVGCGPASQVCL